MGDATDNKVLSQLMLLQGTLVSMPTDESMSRFVSRGFKSVPGVSSLNVCVRGAVAEKTDLCPSCNYRWGEGEDNFDHLCKRGDYGNTKRFPIRTADRLYGFVVFTLNDTPDAFTPYEPYLQNIVNVIATTIENRQQRELLEAFNKQMQIEVEHRMQVEQTLREKEDLLNATGEMAKVGGWAIDKETLEVLWTNETYQIHELPLWYTPPLEEAINYFHPEDRDKLSDKIQRALKYGEAYDMEIRFITAKGKHLWTRTICVPQVVDGKIVRLKGTFQDITEFKHYEEKLKYFAIHDQLTGLLNRHSLEDMLGRTIAKAKRGAVSSILYMDLDNFKDVNDSVGHSAGDEVLITLAGLLKDAVRTEDIVFRLGGDEFSALLEGMAGRDSLYAAERLRSIIEVHPFEVEGRVFSLSLSIGLVEIDGILETRALMSKADAAMYRAKAEGKNRVVVA